MGATNQQSHTEFGTQNWNAVIYKFVKIFHPMHGCLLNSLVNLIMLSAANKSVVKSFPLISPQNRCRKCDKSLQKCRLVYSAVTVHPNLDCGVRLIGNS